MTPRHGAREVLDLPGPQADRVSGFQKALSDIGREVWELVSVHRNDVDGESRCPEVGILEELLLPGQCPGVGDGHIRYSGLPHSLDQLSRVLTDTALGVEVAENVDSKSRIPLFGRHVGDLIAVDPLFNQ